MRSDARRRAGWYVLQVPAGRERAAARRLTRVLEGLLTEPVFAPSFITETKVRGEWVPVVRPMAEGYLVAPATDGRELADRLARGSASPVRVLGGEGPEPLSAAEALLLGGMGEPGSRAVPMSRGYKFDDGSIGVFDGPLRGRESLIASVDRRKSVAVLELPVPGGALRSRAGLALLPAPSMALAG